jgi:hypothetical protein
MLLFEQEGKKTIRNPLEKLFQKIDWSVLKNSVAVRSEDFWVLARLRRRSMAKAPCD